MKITTDALLKQFPYLTARAGAVGVDAAVNVPPERLVEFVRALRDTFDFKLLTDFAGCDWGAEAEHRFGIVAHFAHVVLDGEKSGAGGKKNGAGSAAGGGFREIVRVACAATDNAAPSLPSLAWMFPVANWFEREAFDFFGISFTGHPDLRRLFMWDGYPAHPLRKDFPLAGIEAPLPAEDQLPDAKTKIVPAPLEGGPFVASAGETPREREPRGR